MVSKRRERTPEEVAASFVDSTGGLKDGLRDGDTVFDPFAGDPEPDLAREAGLTTIGTVDMPGDPPPAAPAPAPTLPGGSSVTMETVLLALTRALEGIAAGQVNSQRAATEALDMAAKMQQPDNRTGPNISDFNPQGDSQHPRPKLRCPMFLPWEAEPESLTWEEIELLNLLREGEYAVRRNDGVKVRVTIRVKMNLNGTPDILLMNSESAFNDENSWMMPPLVDILRQILMSNPETKHAGASVMTMDERRAAVAARELPVSVGLR